MEISSSKRKSRPELLSFMEDSCREVLRRACMVEKKPTDDCGDIIFTSTPHPKKAGQGAKCTQEPVPKKNLENTDLKDVSCHKILSLYSQGVKKEAVEKCKGKFYAREEQLLQERAADEAQLFAKAQANSLKIQEEQLKRLKEEEACAAKRKQRHELQQQRHAQRLSMRDEQIKVAELEKKEAEQEHKKKLAIQKKRADEIKGQLDHFSEMYHKICAELKSCQSLSPLLQDVRPLNESILSIVKRISCRDINEAEVSEAEVNEAKSICAQMNTIYLHVIEAATKIRKEAEETEALKQKALQVEPHDNQPKQDKSLSSAVLKDSSSLNELSDCADKKSLQWYQELKSYKQNNQKQFEALIKDDSLKQFRFDCQKAVNIPVNAISPVSPSHLRDKLQKLTLLLSGQPVAIGDGIRVSAAHHPAGIPFCKDLLAKKFVRQGASTVSSKPEAAFAMAAVIVALWQDFPDWGRLLLAHFHQECPYLVPVFWPQLEGQSNKDYYLSLGYTYNEEGEVEKQDKFLKRMSGIMRLYAAVLISRSPSHRRNIPHPHDLGQGWRWLTSLLNLEPRPDICASILYDFLEVAGSSMLEQYGRQYRKLLLVICKGYFPRLREVAVSSGGPVVRLETYLHTILKQGGSKPPQGMLPANFW